ncbi:hypothetical protein ALC53_09909 [Atta colombica]|uniref:Reverse transcriptase/retrotransposon-derived protein RNase H-like domain-containing protein n=1 Tax=Atta colombica TaxID=520822 RepID=A0A195B530_9HYME|nr:hypothetical protein ALC53_09909 [Atta colombica]
MRENRDICHCGGECGRLKHLCSSPHQKLQGNPTKSTRPPQTLHGLHHFVSLIKFYRKFLPTVKAPLNEYLRDSRKNDRWAIAWTHTAEEAFNKYKDVLSAQLSHFSDSASDETRLIYDVSDFAMEQSLSNI